MRVRVHALDGAGAVAERERPDEARPLKHRAELQPAGIARDSREVRERLRHAADLLHSAR